MKGSISPAGYRVAMKVGISLPALQFYSRYVNVLRVLTICKHQGALTYDSIHHFERAYDRRLWQPRGSVSMPKNQILHVIMQRSCLHLAGD